MLTMIYQTKVGGIGVKATVALSGTDDGRLSIAVQSVYAAGLSFFGMLKGKAAQTIQQQLNAKGIVAISQGSTVFAVLPNLNFIPSN